MNKTSFLPFPLHRGSLVLLVGALTLATAGCSSVSKVQTVTLPNAEQLASDAANPNARVFRGPQARANFQQVEIAPITFAEEPELAAEQKNELTQRLASALVEATKATAGSPAGGDRIVVVAKILAVDLANPGTNVFTAAILGAPVDMGGLVVEIEARSVATGERIAAARYVEAGKPWHFKANFSALGHALRAADRVAEQFGRLLATP